ncbi:MAG: FkbM family methyltransferase [Ilumatobacteraceae bacterium]
MNLGQSINRLLGRKGLELRRSDAYRRACLLRHHRIDLVFDVGAARGMYGRELRKSGYEAVIVSFEPLDDAFARLQRESSDDPKWHVRQNALGATTGDLVINIAGNSDSSSLLPMLDRHTAAAPTTSYVGAQTVSLRRLDELAGEWMDSASRVLLKIDTQGFERDVLEGANGIINDIWGVQIELTFEPLYEGGMLFDEAIELLLSRGFVLQGLEPGFRDPANQQLLQADGLFFRALPR